MQKNKQIKRLKAVGIGVAKALAPSIFKNPLYAAFLSSVIGAWEGYQSSRSEDWIEDLAEKIEKIGEDKMDKSYIQSEEFYDLFTKACRIRLQSRSKQKARFILGLVTESMRIDRDIQFSTSIKELFLSIIGQLSDDEMESLVDFYQGKYSKKAKNDIYELGNDRKSIAIDGLFAKGILVEKGYTSNNVIINGTERYIIESRLGREFFAYLKLLSVEQTL